MEKYKKNKKGFTLAEIIISMTIIGVIAAITIPALLVSTNEKALDAQRKALHARIAQAISQIDDLRVYAQADTSATPAVDKGSAINFLNNALSKVYRINAICEKADISRVCNFPEEIITQDESGTIFKIAENGDTLTYLNSAAAPIATLGNLNTEPAAFITSNGESIVVFYNPKCHGSDTNGFYGGNAAAAMCLNFIYDLNGKKEAPNEVGKDVGFITVFFPKDPDVTAPVTYSSDTTGTMTDYAAATTLCKNENNSLIIPNAKEGLSIALNAKLTHVESGNYIVSGAGSTEKYSVNTADLLASHGASWAGTPLLRCVYNN